MTDKFISYNPFTLEKYCEFDTISDIELIEKLNKSKLAFSENWLKISVKERSKLINTISSDLLAEKHILSRLITDEMGKPLKESLVEIEKIAWLIDYHCENASKFLKPLKIKTEYSEVYVSYEPLGGILGIMPWNFPFWQAFRFIIPTLLAGNTVLIKHAPNVPRCALAIERLISKRVGEGIYQNLFISLSQVRLVIENPFIKAVSLTGSERAGKAVAEIAGRNLKKCVLELGGNDPFIILKDADIAKAIGQFITSRFSNNGQICIAAKRLLVEKAVLSEVKTLLLEKIKRLKTGEPSQSDTDLTCLARNDLDLQLEKQVKDLVNNGAEALYYDQNTHENRSFAKVLQLEGLSSINYDEEVFGPVALLIAFEDEEQLIKIINNSRFGLGASIWSNDVKKAKILASKIEVGTVAINKMVSSDPRIPFGGTKNSGYGREMAEAGMKEFVNAKSIVIA